MLHKPDPDSTAPVDNYGIRTLADYTPRDFEGVIAAAAEVRDQAIAAVERLSVVAIDAGCDPVRIRQAAGVL